MKKNAAVIFVVLCLILSSVAAACAETTKSEEFIGGMGKKFVRGVVNTFTGWVEFPAQICKGYKKDNIGGAFLGIFTGVWHGLGRTLYGFEELAGFWAADPASNEGVGIPLDAEYAWEEGTPYDLSKPSFGEATLTPIGNKLGRGLGNAICGFLEFPGQIVKGIKLKAFDVGIGKALWYWYSREIDGIYDVCTFPLPNPKDTKALAFDEKWPWSALGEGMK